LTAKGNARNILVWAHVEEVKHLFIGKGVLS